jgi:hypothetical protein
VNPQYLQVNPAADYKTLTRRISQLVWMRTGGNYTYNLTTISNVYWTTVNAGSLEISPMCVRTSANPLIGPICSWGSLPAGTNGQLIVDVFPPGYFARTISAQGLTQGLQILWMYRYVFGGLNFTD